MSTRLREEPAVWPDMISSTLERHEASSATCKARCCAHVHKRLLRCVADVEPFTDRM